MNKKSLFTLFVSIFAIGLSACTIKKEHPELQNADKDSNKKVLFVVTSHDKVGDTGTDTGYYMSEVTHTWDVLHEAGIEIDIVSPKGGKAPVDAFDLEDPINEKFWNDTTYRSKIENTLKPSDIDPEDYSAIYYAGGHGTMWDFPDNIDLQNIAREIYERGGVIASVCHGPSGIVNIKLSNGKYLVDGKRINSFTNEEEISLNMHDAMPFMLESKLIERGAFFEKSGIWEPHITVDQRVITGQNPQSAKGLGEALLKEISK